MDPSDLGAQYHHTKRGSMRRTGQVRREPRQHHATESVPKSIQTVDMSATRYYGLTDETFPRLLGIAEEAVLRAFHVRDPRGLPSARCRHTPVAVRGLAGSLC